jgi:hypothetical protein
LVTRDSNSSIYQRSNPVLGEINSGYINDNQSLAGSRKSINLQPVMLMPHGPGDMDR